MGFLSWLTINNHGFPMALVVKKKQNKKTNKQNPSAMQETEEMQVWSLGREDPLEEGMTTHSTTLAWRIPWTEVPGGLQSIGLQRVGHDGVTNTFTLRANQSIPDDYFVGLTIWVKEAFIIATLRFPGWLGNWVSFLQICCIHKLTFMCQCFTIKKKRHQIYKNFI